MASSFSFSTEKESSSVMCLFANLQHIEAVNMYSMNNCITLSSHECSLPYSFVWVMCPSQFFIILLPNVWTCSEFLVFLYSPWCSLVSPWSLVEISDQALVSIVLHFGSDICVYGYGLLTSVLSLIPWSLMSEGFYFAEGIIEWSVMKLTERRKPHALM